MSIKVLIIEDDDDLARGIRAFLHKDFSIHIATSGAEGLKKFEQAHYHLVMLDLKLPDMLGLAVCQALRRMEQETPILVLTGNDNMEDQIKLLDAGADDYVVKPFDGRQLRARIDALLRRTGLTSKSMLQTHDLTIDTRKRQVKRAGDIITLRRKEYDILEYLTRNKGQTMTRALIFDNVWEGEGWSNSLEVHIKHLRDRVDRPFDTSLIETIHGVGYLVKDLPVK
ncbi:MAG TPA: response regulator transcription factor [Nevskiaceae bacterium]|nr:response regulator transcription factor [Nevskiaceae bacterium]